MSLVGARAEVWRTVAVPAVGRLVRWAPRATLLLILWLAVYQRIGRITEWPIQFHPTLQYENALTARWIWLHVRAAPLSPNEASWLQDWHGRLKAPPVLEFLTALTYLVDNHERPWVASLFTSAFWLLGAGILLGLFRALKIGQIGTLSSLSFYLIAPFGIIVSRSFQHEALLTCMFLWALWVLVRLEVPAGWRGTLLAGLASGLAGLVKPGIVLLPLLGAYLALSIQVRGLRRTIFDPRSWTFAAVAVLPSVAFALAFLSQESHQFLPHLLSQWMFYRWWAWNIGRVIGWIPLLCAIAGAVVMGLRRRSFLGIGLFAGYIAYALVFSYANMTHDYYLVPLLVITALGLGALVEAVAEPLITRIGIPAVMTEFVAAVALLATVFVSVGTRGVLPPPEGVELAESYREIGTAVGAGSRVLSLSHAYGYALMYHAWLSSYWWPNAGDKWYEGLRNRRVIPDDVRLRRQMAEIRPSHFVITELDEFAGQPDLARLLRTRYCVQLGRADAIVYDLRTRCTAGGPIPD